MTDNYWQFEKSVHQFHNCQMLEPGEKNHLELIEKNQL